MPAVDITQFKAGMRRLAASVNLITTCTPDGQRSGLTATAVCSVSAEPPTLLICVNRGGASHGLLLAAGVFAVNVLAIEDRALADRFASPIPQEQKFEHGLWASLVTGAPVLESAIAGFDCRITNNIDIGTHGVLFGEIQAIRLRTVDASPLLFRAGDYGSTASLREAVGDGLLWMPTWDPFD
jgi:flavin reductase (DIM6/NTAB) family NADH-FMN oxidoreductase RutF